MQQHRNIRKLLTALSTLGFSARRFKKETSITSSIISTCSMCTTAFLSSSSLQQQQSPSPFFASLLHCEQRRYRRISFYLNFDNPEEALLHCEEHRTKLHTEGKTYTTEYLQSLINTALAYYHTGDYKTAREMAIHAHNMVLKEKGNMSTLLYFSATTASKCCTKLAEEYEKFVLEREGPDREKGFDFLRQQPDLFHSRTLPPERFIVKLHEEAAAFQAIATRIFNHPTKYFMRSREDEEKARQGSWEEEYVCEEEPVSSRAASYRQGQGKGTSSSFSSSYQGKKRVRSTRHEVRRARVKEEQERAEREKRDPRPIPK